jgi:hypothetical protein
MILLGFVFFAREYRGREYHGLANIGGVGMLLLFLVFCTMDLCSEGLFRHCCIHLCDCLW